MTAPLPPNPIFVALDTADTDIAIRIGEAVRPHVGGLKLGLEFFSAHGPEGIRRIRALGLPIFLDVKLHDIPNTVAGAVRALNGLGIAILNVHAAGGRAMLRAAATAAAEAGAARPRVIAVTVLTSLDAGDLARHGVPEEPHAHALRLASLASEAGLDGVVCAGPELVALRAHLGGDFLLVTPGLRPEGARSSDQKRVMTPAEARRGGADVLVIGRPITQAPDPAAAARAIAATLAP